MSNSTSNKRKLPKLSPINLPSTNDRGIVGQSSLGSATSNESSCDLLDSTVEVNVGDGKNILISPESLIVMKQLGRGQYGIVEKVYHQQSECYFAVKRVALKPGDDDRTRLLMDVDILVKGTKCENIIKFFGALIWEGDLWIIMELMDCSLDKFYKLAHHKKAITPTINNIHHKQSLTVTPCIHVDADIPLGNCLICNPIPEKVLGRMASDILNALSYLYSIKVIHRDIKPSNILISRVGIIKLCDFGISGYLVNSVARTYEAGCRPYMAPERIDPPRDSIGYDIKSDVWSFGITMLEIATGRYPYHHARDFFEQLKSICKDDAPEVPKGRFSANFESFIAHCLRKNFQSRPKYDQLMSDPFIELNKNLNISQFTDQVITRSIPQGDNVTEKPI